MASKSGFRVALILMIQWLMTNWAVAQYFTWGTEPGMQWKERNGSRVSIIAPASFRADSIFLTYFDSACHYQSLSLPVYPKQLHIVLHPNSLMSNGFVAWAPARSELFTVPARDFYPGFWPQQLAWHEMRHYGQFSMARYQIKKRTGFIFGEYLSAGWMGLAVPSWYLEGDATSSETAFTETGRGRSPSFCAPFFAWLSDQEKVSSYDQCLLGSDEKFIPDRYVYGYWMVAKGSAGFGEEFWPAVFKETFMKNNFGMFPRTFKQVNNQHTALRKYHRSVLQSIKDSVNQEMSELQATKSRHITSAEEYCMYRAIGLTSQGTIVAFKKSLHGEPCFISIDSSGQEQKIFQTHYIHDESFGFDGKNVYYSEYRPHERHAMVDFSRSVVLDIDKKSTKNLSVTYKELLPALSPDGKMLVRCAYRNNGTYAVSIIGTETHQTLGWAEFSYAEQPISIAIDNDARHVYMIQQTITQRRIVHYDALLRSSQVLFASSTNNIASLVLHGNHLYFSADLNGNDEIYRIPLSGGTPECLTSTAFGAAYPLPDNHGGLYFSELTPNGYQIRFVDSIHIVEPSNRWTFMFTLADTLRSSTLQWIDSVRFDPVLDAPAKPYQKSAHLIHVHSWGPFSIDPSAQGLQPGLQFDTQNMLSTLYGSVFSGYNPATATIESGLRFTWQGWYPIIETGYTNHLPFNGHGRIEKAYHSFSMNASLPLIYTHHAWTFRIRPYLEARPWIAKDSGRGMYHQARYGSFITFSAQRYTNARNIYPRSGIFAGGGSYYQTDQGYEGFLSAITGGCWLPGFFRHDGFRLRAGYEKRDSNAFSNTTLLNAPRGYVITEDDIERFFSSEYSSPLLYPDFHIGSLVFLKRLSIMLSYDYGSSSTNRALTSAGIHLMADVHFLRLYTPIQCVFSEYFLQPAKTWQFSFGFRYNLYSY